MFQSYMVLVADFDISSFVYAEALTQERCRCILRTSMYMRTNVPRSSVGITAAHRSASCAATA